MVLHLAESICGLWLGLWRLLCCTGGQQRTFFRFEVSSRFPQNHSRFSSPIWICDGRSGNDLLEFLCPVVIANKIHFPYILSSSLLVIHQLFLCCTTDTYLWNPFPSFPCHIKTTNENTHKHINSIIVFPTVSSQQNKTISDGPMWVGWKKISTLKNGMDDVKLPMRRGVWNLPMFTILFCGELVSRRVFTGGLDRKLWTRVIVVMRMLFKKKRKKEDWFHFLFFS